MLEHHQQQQQQPTTTTTTTNNTNNNNNKYIRVGLRCLAMSLYPKQLSEFMG
jgi:hypothetical protein